jgi:nucleotide-binding universal stress UspA family protein
MILLTRPRRGSREDASCAGAAGKPVLLATLDVPFADEAAAFAVDAAVENGQPLVLVNAAEVLPTIYTVLGYGYVERDALQEALSKPAELARSLAVEVERLRVCSPHPVEALLELVVERNPSLLVFGPERSALSRRRYRKAARAVRERAPCLVWTDDR